MEKNKYKLGEFGYWWANIMNNPDIENTEFKYIKFIQNLDEICTDFNKSEIIKIIKNSN